MRQERRKFYAEAVEKLFTNQTWDPDYLAIAQVAAESPYPHHRIRHEVLDNILDIRNELRDELGHLDCHCVGGKYYEKYTLASPRIPITTLEQAIECIAVGRDNPSVGIRIPPPGTTGDLVFMASVLRAHNIGQGIKASAIARVTAAVKAKILEPGAMKLITGMEEDPEAAQSLIGDVEDGEA